MKKQLSPEEINLVSLAKDYSDEDKARGLLEKLRWPNGATCPHCQFNEVYKLKPGKGSSTRSGVYKCSACRKQFTVTVGTIFEGSHIPISKWLMAVFILCSSKKAISAHQLHRMLDITYKSAWFMAHRIRYAMGPDMPLGKLLAGTVEVDETFVGGKETPKTKGSKKVPVVALIQRDGEVRTKVVSSVTAKNLKQCLNECVDHSATINTDDAGVYRKTAVAEYKGHATVNHSAYEYARTEADGSVVSVNQCESFFSLLKRGVHGAWHHVSKEHLPKYANEFAFRWNNRKVSDGERMAKAIELTKGKRLSYKPLTTGIDSSATVRTV